MRCANCAAACSSSVDLPMPGSPPSSTSDPGTIPPPSTRSNSPMPVLSRSDAGASTSAYRRAAPPPLHASTLDLRPALSLASRIVAVKGLRPGEGTGYGLRWSPDTPRAIAIVPAGYADGLDTRLANRASVLVGGRRVPIVGSVCMDMIMVDVTDLDVSPGDEVVIIGCQGDEEISARELAATIGAIPWEVVCRLGSRIERRYVDTASSQKPKAKSQK